MVGRMRPDRDSLSPHSAAERIRTSTTWLLEPLTLPLVYGGMYRLVSPIAALSGESYRIRLGDRNRTCGLADPDRAFYY